MDKMDFQFQNREQCQNSQRKEFLYEGWIKRFFILSSCVVFFGFFVLKILWSVNFNKQYSNFELSKSSAKEEKFEKAHILPLLVNLKGEKGPQLVRLQVYIALNKNFLEKEFLSQGKEFEKHLLFILSGQEVKDLQKKRSYFEQKIRSQLNAFLSEDIVDGVRIQTERIN